MYVILIDSGTTNTRIRLVSYDYHVVDAIKLKVGVRNSAIDGRNDRLKREIHSGIKEIINKNQLTPKQVTFIVASGMITSNLGLYEVPHITAPAKINDFIKNAKVIQSNEFLQIPCLFIPGLKNQANELFIDSLQDIDEMDVMRGEEVEALGLLKQLSPKGKGIMVLPGSHTKYLLIDENQSFLSSCTTLGGEVIQAIRSNTILSSSLGERLLETVDLTSLLAGFRSAKKVGLTRSFFHIRLLQLSSNLTENERANYYVGAVLQSDIAALDSFIKDRHEIDWMIVGGASPLRRAFVHVLKTEYREIDIIEADDSQAELSLVHGAMELGKNYFEMIEGGAPR
ncbi:2-dehydro-3-deoxygalactonokinase [Halalkalibacter alkaliphilus]|uniref:2-dehydro-3-deoxygalactonokinase n=1 Tax=Halalkalibacter alkaliphilus TaxID=2917993 RepID=A0A9X2A166_9BACI|nr:2-dehydro-3-deoxygalactonokinase [Halalkalibacter alkaliphilus]